MSRKSMIYGWVLGLMIFSRIAHAESVPLYLADELRFAEQNGHEYVYDKEGNLLNGAVNLPDEDGGLITYIYRDGRKNGVAVKKFTDGQVELETTYANGAKNGEEIKFAAPSVMQYKKTYKDNQLNGEYILFFTNGKPSQKSMYVADKLDGETIYFDDVGNVTRIENYKNDIKNGVERIIENNVLVAENIYKDGKLNGLAKRYNAQYLTDEINYADGLKDGKYISYQSDGSRREVMYRRDLREGISEAYYANQKLAQRTDYRQNVKDGKSEKWDQEGILLVSENYRNGQADGINRYFDAQGKLQKVNYNINGVKLAEIIIAEDEDLSNIYQAYLQGVLNEYSMQKKMWYKILWLGLNLEKNDILTELKAQMQMYGENIADIKAYERALGNSFAEENRLLFFGLSPLGYAVDIALPVHLLQQLTPDAAQINTLNARGTTVLQEAVHLNNAAMVKYLLLQGADAHYMTADGRTILFDAVIENADNDVLSALLKANIDINAQDEKKNTALSLAVKKHHEGQVEFLLQHGADAAIKAPTGENLLSYAVAQSAPRKIVALLVDTGVDVNEINRNGNLPLIMAVKQADMPLVQKLLARGADINKLDAKGQNALSVALGQDIQPEIAKIILAQPQDSEHNVPQFNKMLWQILAEQNYLTELDAVLAKIDMTKPDINGIVPQAFIFTQKNRPELIEVGLRHMQKVSDELMFEVAQKGDAATLEKLIAKGGNVNAQKDSDSLLMALTTNQPEMVDLLLQNGADIHYVNANQQTVLMRAVEHLNLSLVKAALSQGSDVAVRDAEGNVAVHYLAEAAVQSAALPVAELTDKMQKVADILIKHGADINAPNADGATVLILLAQKHISAFNEVTEMLQNLGADANVKDQYGRTAADYQVTK